MRRRAIWPPYFLMMMRLVQNEGCALWGDIPKTSGDAFNRTHSVIDEFGYIDMFEILMVVLLKALLIPPPNLNKK